MSSSLDDPSNLLAPDAVADALECVNFRFVSFRQKPELGQKPEPTMSREEAEGTVQKMLADWVEKNGDTLNPNLEQLTEADEWSYQVLEGTRRYHPIDYMKDCRDNPDYLRVLAQYNLIQEKMAAERKNKAEKPD